MVSPFNAYAAGFVLALSIYSLGYSDLYPTLSSSLVTFLLVTCGASIIIGLIQKAPDAAMCRPHDSVRSQLAIYAAIMLLFIAEIIANSGVPLLLIVQGADVTYHDFGIPVLHVVFTGTCYFFSVYWFDLYLVSRVKTFVLLALSAMATSVLIVSRGAFIVTSIAFVGVYLLRRGASKKLFLGFAMLGAGVLWGFGFLGDIRTHGASGESIILAVGDASDKFRNSNIPTELFWPYLYASSPLANLQLNVTDRVLPDSPELYALLEFLPDFVSKRLVSDDVTSETMPLLITPTLTVCTMYGRAFALMGWMGIVCNFIYFIFVSTVSLQVLKSSRYLVATTGILSSLAFLGIFDNMYIISGGILQVLIGLILSIFEVKSAAPKEKPQGI